MEVFFATLEQTAFLFLFIVVGYMLSRGGLLPDNSQAVLSKLENYIFIPALVLGTFITNFTVEKLGTTWQLLLSSVGLGLIAIVLSLLIVRVCSKDEYERRIYAYGLCFSNFGFMGNAVVSALFPDIFLDYLIFTLPLWAFIYLWGVPVLLIGDGGRMPGIKERLKNFLNPMFIATILGMLIGVSGIPMPDFVITAVDTAGGCMSPIAMLLTGMTIAKYKLGDVLKIKGVYLVSIIRLLVFPLAFIGVVALFPIPETFAILALCSLAMPLGLNTIIIPSALGKDTRVAAGMALVSHVLSCITIPLILMLFKFVTAL